jgi:hypothetical protein
MSQGKQADGSFVECEICGNVETRFGTDWAICLRECPRCGTYKYYSTVGWIKISSSGHLVRLSGWVREQNDSGVEYPEITTEVYRRTMLMTIPKLRDRASRALTVIARMWPGLTDWFDPREFAQSPELLGRSYSLDEDDALNLMEILMAHGSLRSDLESACGLSVQGLLEVEDLEAVKSNSTQGFVAMSFSAVLEKAWTSGFDPAIRAAGFTPMRIDAKEFVGGISDEIISEIRRSRFVVVDYTEQKNGVYFEAGLALGLGLVVIPTCHVDDIDKLHFDIRHLNTLLWKEPEDLVASLSNRIKAVIST